ncbi:MAG: ABC transporter ATP-binding protein [Lachnospiraceae bacterium]|nr:ABC transporter ATP-binding protein [Lachnospiraceae bacterium]
MEIRLENIKKSFNKPVLKNINLKIDNESYIAIVGKSGSGKSTLMNIIGLIEDFDEGSYRFNSINIKSGKDYSDIRLNNIGFIFQSYNLIPTMTCRENILVPTLYASKKVDLDILARKLDIYSLLDTNVNVLSGGEKQRVAIARALIMNPELIIADEPTGNLDEMNREIVFDILKRENKEGRGIVMITHDPSTAEQAKNIYRLENGILEGIKYNE